MLSVGCWWSSVVWWPHVSAGNTAEDPDPFNTIRLIITKTCTPGIIRSNNTAQSSTPPGIVFKLSLEACCYSLNMFNCFYESCEQKFFCFIVHGLHNHIHITWDNLLLWSEQSCNVISDFQNAKCLLQTWFHILYFYRMGISNKLSPPESAMLLDKDLH